MVNSGRAAACRIESRASGASKDSEDSNMNSFPSIVTSPFRPFDSDDKVQYRDETRGGGPSRCTTTEHAEASNQERIESRDPHM